MFELMFRGERTELQKGDVITANTQKQHFIFYRRAAMSEGKG